MTFEVLTSEGGKVAVIIFMLCFIIAVSMTMALTGHPLQEAGKELASGAVGSLLALLYKRL